MKSIITSIRKTLAVFSIFALLSISALAEQDSTQANIKKQNQFAVGAQLGLATGSGVSVRYTMDFGLALETTMFYFSTGKPIWNIGFEAQYALSHSEIEKFYVVGGVSYYYNGGSFNQNTLNGPSRFGIGLGYEWYFLPNVSIAGELPFTFFLGDNAPTVLPLPQLQLMYHIR
ncbi:MAG: hypothetical protein HQ472_04105 [Ignavibacteria bacterium]|nr:hypothetical protein [Ignavibacteria bacterium]